MSKAPGVCEYDYLGSFFWPCERPAEFYTGGTQGYCRQHALEVASRLICYGKRKSAELREVGLDGDTYQLRLSKVKG